MLALAVSASGDYMVSGGLDAQIFLWSMPNFETIDQYDAYCEYIEFRINDRLFQIVLLVIWHVFFSIRPLFFYLNQNRFVNII